MKRKLFCMIFAVLTAAAVWGCGGQADVAGGADDTPGGEMSSSDEDSDVLSVSFDEASQGQVLNIYCVDDEAKRIFSEYYPGYEAIDAFSGRIGDTAVNWVQIVTGGDEEDADAATDIIIAGSGEAVDLVQQGSVLPLSQLGIREESCDQQFPYTRQVVSDAEGVVYGTSWECRPGVFFYNRDMAVEIFGSDDPDVVRDYVRTWDAFADTAGIMRAAGYRMTASVDDIFSPYAQRGSSPWVEDGVLNVDSAYEEWAKLSAAMVSVGQTTVCERFTSSWEAGMKSTGGVFCYPASEASLRPYMHEGEEGYVATEGRWAVTPAPTGFFDGGSWILAAKDTDNPALAADIMRRLTLDRTIMRKMAEDEGIFVNNRALMEKMASEGRPSEALGGQSPLDIYLETADRITLAQAGPYDYDCIKEYTFAMQNYFEGNATFEEAMELFKTTIIERYPQLGVGEAE